MQKNAEHALTILINLTSDQKILEYVASDEKFLDLLIGYVTVCVSGPLNAFTHNY